MVRIARVVAPDMSHHISQRGNRRLETFFCDADYELYLELMAQWCKHWEVLIWAYLARLLSDWLLYRYCRQRL